MLGITVVISFLLSIFLSSSFSYDAASKWDIYATALPLSEKNCWREVCVGFDFYVGLFLGSMHLIYNSIFNIPLIILQLLLLAISYFLSVKIYKGNRNK